MHEQIEIPHSDRKRKRFYVRQIIGEMPAGKHTLREYIEAVIAGWGSFVEEPPPPPPPVDGHEVPPSIDATGASDVSAALQAFVNGVPDGGAIVFPPDSTYLLGGDGIAVFGRNDLTFIGQGSTLRFTGCHGRDSAFYMSRSNRIRIQDFVLIGDNTGSWQQGCESSSGVSMYGCADVTIERVTVENAYGHCWYVDASQGLWSDGVTVSDSACVRPGTMGFAVTSGRNLHVERTLFEDVAIIPIDIEPYDTAGGGEDITVVDCVFDGFGTSPRWTPWVLAADVDKGHVRNVEFARNRIVDGPQQTQSLITNAGLSVGMNGTSDKRDIRIVDNVSDVPGNGPAMRFNNVHGVTVRGNVQEITSGELAVFRNSTDVTYEP